jgi:hypothetical protein
MATISITLALDLGSAARLILLASRTAASVDFTLAYAHIFDNVQRESKGHWGFVFMPVNARLDHNQRKVLSLN